MSAPPIEVPRIRDAVGNYLGSLFFGTLLVLCALNLGIVLVSQHAGALQVTTVAIAVPVYGVLARRAVRRRVVVDRANGQVIVPTLFRTHVLPLRDVEGIEIRTASRRNPLTIVYANGRRQVATELVHGPSLAAELGLEAHFVQ